MHDKNIGDFLPDTDVIFPGKPVNTRNGRGFVLGAKKDAAEKTYYVKIKDEVYEVKQKDFQKDRADNFIEKC